MASLGIGCVEEGTTHKEKPTSEHLQSEWQMGLEDAATQKENQYSDCIQAQNRIPVDDCRNERGDAGYKEKKKKITQGSRPVRTCCTDSDFGSVWTQSALSSRTILHQDTTANMQLKIIYGAQWEHSDEYISAPWEQNKL